MGSQRHDVNTSLPVSTPALEFEINRTTTPRDSLRLSVDETKALDALRTSLKWDYDLSLSKNDICRAALHWLLDEFASKGEKSAAVGKRKHSNR